MGHELTRIDPQHRGRENKSKGPITTGVMQEVETGVYWILQTVLQNNSLTRTSVSLHKLEELEVFMSPSSSPPLLYNLHKPSFWSWSLTTSTTSCSLITFKLLNDKFWHNEQCYFWNTPLESVSRCQCLWEWWHVKISSTINQCWQASEGKYTVRLLGVDAPLTNAVNSPLILQLWYLRFLFIYLQRNRNDICT